MIYENVRLKMQRSMFVSSFENVFF